MTAPTALSSAALLAAFAGPLAALAIGRSIQPNASAVRLLVEAALAAAAGLGAGIWTSGQAGAIAAAGAAAGVGAITANALLDLRTQRLSDLLTLIGAAGALLAGPGLFGAADRMSQLYGGAVAALVLLLAATYVRWRRAGRIALGAGDIGVAAACGVFVGGFGAAPALAIAALATLPAAALKGGAVPFGPGLAVGFAATGTYAAYTGGVL